MNLAEMTQVLEERVVRAAELITAASDTEEYALQTEGIVSQIHDLIARFCDKEDRRVPEDQRGTLLYRDKSTIREHLADFFVMNYEGRIIGSAGLLKHDANGASNEEDNCLEIISLAVLPKYQHNGYGSELFEIALAEAQARGVDYVFALVNPAQIQYFEHKGFKIKDDGVPTPKMLSECAHCPRHPLNLRISEMFNGKNSNGEKNGGANGMIYLCHFETVMEYRFR